MKRLARYEATVPVSVILSAVYTLANDYCTANEAGSKDPIQAMNDLCNGKVTEKPKKPKKGDKLGIFTFSIIEPEDSEPVETDLTVVDG